MLNEVEGLVGEKALYTFGDRHIREVAIKAGLAAAFQVYYASEYMHACNTRLEEAVLLDV